MMIDHPERPVRAPDETRKPTGSLIPVVTVLGFVLALIVTLVGFTGPAGLYIVVAISGVFAIVALHYFLWGWWLTKRLHEADETESSDTEE